MIDYAKKSLTGVWVGDCIGNLGQLYFVHDILKALESGMIKFGGQLDRFNQQFVYALAMEFATRYMDRDPDGEIYGV